MLLLIWGLLNIAVFIYAITLCVKITKYVRAKLGVFAAFVLVLILLSSFSRSGQRDENLEPNSNHIKTWRFIPKDSIVQGQEFAKEVTMEKDLAVRYNVGISYVIDEKTKLPIPTDGYSDNTGFVSGISWHPMQITINKTLDSCLFRFDVDGIVKWKLLGITLYAQDKHYSGVISLKDSHDD